MSNKAIAHQLGISPRTVEGHLNHVFDKLGVLSRTELVHYALATGVFGRDAPAGRTGAGVPDDHPDPWRDPTPVGRRWGHRTRPAEPDRRGGGRRDRDLPPAAGPWADSRFWLLQLVVLALALVRLAATVAFRLDTAGVVLEVSTVPLFVVPVVVAALYFGLPGGWPPWAGSPSSASPRLVRGGADHRSGRSCGPRSSNWPSCSPSPS